MARYVIRATSRDGPVSFQDPLTLDAALRKAAELRDGNFQHITLINTMTGLEITDLENLIRGLDPSAPTSH
jgi:hypothetical protein